jgi:hypothetical protein
MHCEYLVLQRHLLLLLLLLRCHVNSSYVPALQASNTFNCADWYCSSNPSSCVNIASRHCFQVPDMRLLLLLLLQLLLL